MRVLHAAAMGEISSGIVSQMQWEQDAAIEAGLDWDVKIFTILDRNIENNDLFFCSNLKRNEYSTTTFRKEYYNWLETQKDVVDCYVLRYSNFDFYQYKFIKKIGKPVYLVHHTLELPELKLNKNIKAWLQYIGEWLFGRLSIASAQANVGVTEEIFDYEYARIGKKKKDKIVYPNGIFYHKDIKLLEDTRAKNIPEILFVASYFYPWHGLDLLIQSLNSCDREFRLHIVGHVCASDKTFVGCDHRVIFHGHISQSEIEKLMSYCWVGLSSFALFRKNMKQACTLKVREYLKNGLPVYSDYKEVFPEDFPFYRIGKPNINNILDYAYTVNKESKLNISSEAEQYISKVELLNKFYKKICMAET